MSRLALLAYVLLSLAAPVRAQSPCYLDAYGRRVCPRYVTTAGTPLYQPVLYRPVQPAGDAYGFTGWLNATRAAYGLPPVGYDANLSAWANANNGQQQARGMGHHVMGPARRQNAAMGSYATVPGMWMASPAHRAALLDPTIRFIGIAGAGAYWTFNAY